LQKFGVFGEPFCAESQRFAQPPAESKSTQAHWWHEVPLAGWQKPVVVSHVSPEAQSESAVQPDGEGASHWPVVVSQISPAPQSESCVQASVLPEASGLP
jgi:hypothetical protein